MNDVIDGAAPAPLPRAQPAAAAARNFSVAAIAWENALRPDGRITAARQLCYTLRDAGLATSCLAYYRPTDSTGSEPAAPGFSAQVTAASHSILDAYQCLEDALPPASPQPRNDSDPGAALCLAAQQAIRSWRRPAGIAADRAQIIDHLTTALEALARGAQELATQVPCNGQMTAASIHLSAAVSHLTQADEPSLPERREDHEEAR